MTAQTIDQAKTYPMDFHDYESFFKNVHAGDLVSGQVNGYNTDKDNGEIIGAFVTLIPYSRGQKSLSGLINKNYVVTNEDDNLEDILSRETQMTFRIQRVDMDKQRISLSLPSYQLGDKGYRAPKAQPKFEQSAFNYNDPIDNSGVKLSDGEKSISIQFPFPDEKSRNPAFGFLASSIRVLEAEQESLKEVLEKSDSNEKNDDGLIQDPVITKAQKIVDNCLPSGYTTTVYIRNLAFSSADGNRTTPLFGFRLKRSAGDWLSTAANLPLTKTLLFIGRGFNRGTTFSVQHISVITNSEEALPSEVEIDIVNYDDARRIQRPFIFELLGQMVSVARHTSLRLAQYKEYLEWQEKIAKLQIKGFKYVSVDVNREEKQLEFHLIFKNKNEFEEQGRYLRRSELKAFSNEISSEKFSFKYNDSDIKTSLSIRSTDLGYPKGVVQQSYMNQGQKPAFVSEAVYNEILQAIPHPYFVTYAFEMNEEDVDLLNRKEQTDTIEETIQTKILPKYMFNTHGGYLALSAVGELALIQRHGRAIRAMENGDSQNPKLSEWLFDASKAQLPDPGKAVHITQWANPNLAKDPIQREAIEKMVNAKDTFYLQGPPGTGKTTTIAESTNQFAKQGKNVLIASQSNTAVDNALERLQPDPEIRAVRISNRRNRFEQDNDADEKLSENNCMGFFYKSISKKISDDFLDKWEKYDVDLRACNTDLRNLNLRVDSLNHFGTLLQDSQNELTHFSAQMEETRNALIEAINTNRNTSTAIRNQEKFLKVLNGEEDDFTLFESQLNILEDGFWSLNDQNFHLATDYDRTYLNNQERSQYVKIFVNNLLRTRSMLASVKNHSTRKEVKENLDEQNLKAELAKLKQQREETMDENEFHSLSEQISKLYFKLKKSTSSNGTSDFALDDVQKDILSDNMKKLLKANIKKFIQILEAKTSQADTILKDMQSKLTAHTEALQTIDEEAIKKNMDSLTGNISNLQEEIASHENAIRGDQEAIDAIAQRYSLGNRTDIEVIRTAISNQITSIQKREDDSRKEREMFGDLLKGFKQKLDESASSKRIMAAENKIYKDDYIKSCNVVGISCNTDPRILNRNDFGVAIIDEVSKATAPELLMSMMRTRTVVLVGDHRQLPPTFNTNQKSYTEMIQEMQENEDAYTDEERHLISKENFHKFKNMVTASLFKESYTKAPKEIKAGLWTQYRYHKDIMDIVNCFYEGKLKCGISDENMETAKAHGLTIPSLNGTEFITPSRHAYWINSATTPNGEFFADCRVRNSTSLCNYLEMQISLNLLKKMDAAFAEKGFNRENRVKVAIICFYQMQVNKLYKKIKALKFQALDVAVNTVDRFQGQEKGIVIVNMVRNVPLDKNGNARISEHMLAFERINVAFSRAENMLVIVGAKDAFETMDVTLPAMEGEGVVVTKVYRKIIDLLHRRNSVFGSSCLVTQEEVDALKEEMEKDGCQNPYQKRQKSWKNKFKRGVHQQ